MKTGKKILAVMMLAVFMLAANAVLVPATAGAELSLADAIKEGLKSGKSLQQVVDEALKNGNPIEKIVTAAIKAGARADDAVYVAIKAKPGDERAHEKIVKAALLSGAKIETVAGAAQVAGARNERIGDGYWQALVDSGETPPSADAKVEALDLNKGIFAYSPPAGNTSKSTDNTSTTNTSTTNTTSTFSYTVNNTGGATPSTKTASPM